MSQRTHPPEGTHEILLLRTVSGYLEYGDIPDRSDKRWTELRYFAPGTRAQLVVLGDEYSFAGLPDKRILFEDGYIGCSPLEDGAYRVISPLEALGHEAE